MVHRIDRRFAVAFALAALVASTQSAIVAQSAPEFTVGALKIVQPWSRATPRSAPVAGGYLKITNTGSEPDRLVSGASAIAGGFSVHEMKMEGGVMKMRPLAGGLEIKPGTTVELKPGGYHIMFEDLKAGLTEGGAFKATLTFEKAGKIDIDFAVMSIGATAPATADSGHQHH